MAQKGISLRAWTISRADYVNADGDDIGFMDAVANEYAQIPFVQERLGLGVAAAPRRRQGPSGTWFTEAWIFQLETVPAAGKWEPAEVEMPEVDETPPPASGTLPE